jgi:Na+-translocating ferredoxin:NAD+ oxidoreductase RnfG subunit
MRKYQLAATLYQYTFIIIILVALAFRGGRDFLFQKEEAEVTVTLEAVQDIFPSATSFTHNRLGAMDVYNTHGNKIGSALLSTDYSQQYGYGGKVPLLIGVDDSLTITKITLLPNNESSDYIEAIYGDAFIGKWQGVSLEEATQLQVDIVTGATYTSEAVLAGVRNTAAAIVRSDASVIHESKFWTRFKDVLFLGLMLLSLLMVYKKGVARYRTLYMLLVLVIMGVLLNNALSVQLLNGWLQEGFTWRANWQTSVVFLLALLLSFIGKRKFYCNYLCPMGALQELTNRYTPFKRRALPTRFRGLNARELYLLFIAGALLLGFTPPLAHLEPFLFFSFRIVGIGLIAFGVIIVLLSLFFTKPWCSLCPTGCLLDTIAYQKAKKTTS